MSIEGDYIESWGERDESRREGNGSWADSVTNISEVDRTGWRADTRGVSVGNGSRSEWNGSWGEGNGSWGEGERPAGETDAPHDIHDEPPRESLTLEKTHDLHETVYPVRTLDARVLADMQYKKNVISSPNANWVPQYPIVDEKTGILKHVDGFWGGHEYTRWPQFFSKTSIHHACIPFDMENTSKSFVRSRFLVADVALYDPKESEDFTNVLQLDNHDLEEINDLTDPAQRDKDTQMQVGRLRKEIIDNLDTALLLIAAKTRTSGSERRAEGSDDGMDKAYRRCLQAGQFGIERLRLLKSSWRTILFTVRDIQRAILELHGLHTYLDVVLPRIKSKQSYETKALPVRGAFTTDPTVVNQLYRIGIPVWFICRHEQFDGKIFAVRECVPWSKYVEKDLFQVNGRPLHDGFSFKLDVHLRDLSKSQFMVEDDLSELLEQMYGFQIHQPGAPAFNSSSPLPSRHTGTCSPAPSYQAPSAGATSNASSKKKRKRRAEKQKAQIEATQKAQREPYTNYARVLHIPNGVDGRPDLPPYHKIVLDNLTKLGTISQNKTHAALYPLPPPFLLIHAGADKTVDLYLNYIRIRPTLIDMLLKGGIFDKSIWRRLRDWKTIVHGDYMKSTPLPPNTADPFVERIYNTMPSALDTDSSKQTQAVVRFPSSSHVRDMADASDLPPAKRQRISDKATIKVVFGVERHLEPFDRTKKQVWRNNIVSPDCIKRDKDLRMEVQWELSELLFRYELYALDQLILPRDRMAPEEHRHRNALLSCIYLGTTDGSATVIPDISKPIREYWGDQLDDSSVEALFRVLKLWPGFPTNVGMKDFNGLVAFYVQTFVRYFNRVPSMHCNVPVSLL